MYSLSVSAGFCFFMDEFYSSLGSYTRTVCGSQISSNLKSNRISPQTPWSFSSCVTSDSSISSIPDNSGVFLALVSVFCSVVATTVVVFWVVLHSRQYQFLIVASDEGLASSLGLMVRNAVMRRRIFHVCMFIKS